jgi:hypothetical protein
MVISDTDDDVEDVGERLPNVYTTAYPRAKGPPPPPRIDCPNCGPDVPASPWGDCVDCRAIGPRRMPRNPPPLPPESLKPIPKGERTLFERIAFPDPILDV